MIYDASHEGAVAPQSMTILNNVELRPGSPDYIVVQMRIEVIENGKFYSLQTGAVNPSESQGLFYTHKKENKYKLVIETNYVSTWTNTKWDVLYSEDIINDVSCSFVVYGNPEQIAVRKIPK